MTRLLLIRHGNTDLLHEYLCGRTPGISLNEEGRQQARQLGQSLCERYKLAAVYSSPLERAVETAGFVAQPQSLSVIAEEGVNELDFGAWAGARFRDLHNSPEWQSYNQNRSLRSAPGGETLSNVQSRAWTSLRSIADRHDGGTVAVVSHGDVIRALLLLLLGMPLDHILRFEISAGSVSEVSVGAGYPVIHSTNYVVKL
jgi:broad specificity phosphatase PhoE